MVVRTLVSVFKHRAFCKVGLGIVAIDLVAASVLTHNVGHVIFLNYLNFYSNGVLG